MLRYIIKRLLLMLPILLGITILVYFIASLCPGSPLTMLCRIRRSRKRTWRRPRRAMAWISR